MRRARRTIPLGRRRAALLGADAPLDRFSVESQILCINITVRDGARVYQLSAVVTPRGGSTAPPSAAPKANASVEQKKPVVLKMLDYPFKVLELLENVWPVSLALADNPVPHD